MKRDRNRGEKRQKYTVIDNRKLDCQPATAANLATLLASCPDVVAHDPEDAYFVIDLKDMHAGPALLAYAASAAMYDTDYAQEIRELAKRAFHHPHRKHPE
jgi:hypothetical protein